MKIIFYILLTFIAFVNYTYAKTAVRDTIRFAFLADLHVTPENDNDSGLHQIVSEINQLNIDFVVVTGDITNTGTNTELIAVEKALNNLRHSLYIIPGNHETNWSESAGLKFNEIWENDRFAFSCKKINFIGLNTGPYMKMGDGHVKNEDLIWLKDKIKQFDETSNTLIAFTHYPLAYGLDNWPEVANILGKGHCKLVFCGHGHHLRLYNFNGIPGIMGRPQFLKKENSPGYQLVEIYNDSVFVYPKVYRQEKENAAIEMNYLHPDTIQNIPSEALPDYSVNLNYPEAQPFFTYQDSFSIFTGPEIFKDELLIFGNSGGYMKAIHLSNQNLVWQHKFKGSLYSTPQVCNQTVVFGTSDGYVVGLDARNGNLAWQIGFKSPVLAEGIVENNCIYIGCGDSAFAKIDTRSGNVLWKFTDIEGTIQGKPAMDKKFVVFGAWDKYLYCLNKETGKLLWKWTNGKKQKLFSPGNIVPAISTGKVFIVAPDRYMTALDLKTGKELWRTNQHQVRESMGISDDGKTIYAKLMNDTVIAVSALSDRFKLKWFVNAAFGYEHSPCPIVQGDHSVIITTKNGLVVAIDEKNKKVRWKNKACHSGANKILIDNKKNIWITFINGQIKGYKM